MAWALLLPGSPRARTGRATRDDRVDERRARCTIRSSAAAGRSRSPTRKRSRGWRHLRARPTRSTHPLDTDALLAQAPRADACVRLCLSGSNLFGRWSRELLHTSDFREPWRSRVLAAVEMIEDLDEQITAIDRELRELGADHHHMSRC